MKNHPWRLIQSWRASHASCQQGSHTALACSKASSRLEMSMPRWCLWSAVGKLILFFSHAVAGPKPTTTDRAQVFIEPVTCRALHSGLPLSLIPRFFTSPLTHLSPQPQLLPRCRSRTSLLWLCWLRSPPSSALPRLLLPQRPANRMMTTGTALLAYLSLLSFLAAHPTPRLHPLRPQTMVTTTMMITTTTTTTMDTMLSPLPPTRTAAHRTRTTGTAPLASPSLPPLLPRPARLASLHLQPRSLPLAKLRALLARHLLLVLLDSP